MVIIGILVSVFVGIIIGIFNFNNNNDTKNVKEIKKIKKKKEKKMMKRIISMVVSWLLSKIVVVKRVEARVAGFRAVVPVTNTGITVVVGVLESLNIPFEMELFKFTFSKMKLKINFTNKINKTIKEIKKRKKLIVTMDIKMSQLKDKKEIKNLKKEIKNIKKEVKSLIKLIKKYENKYKNINMIPNIIYKLKRIIFRSIKYI